MKRMIMFPPDKDESVVMDPVATQALADLKDLLREKVITLAEWREEVAAIQNRVMRTVQPPAARPPAARAAPKPLHVEVERTVTVMPTPRRKPPPPPPRDPVGNLHTPGS